MFAQYSLWAIIRDFISDKHRSKPLFLLLATILFSSVYLYESYSDILYIAIRNNNYTNIENYFLITSKNTIWDGLFLGVLLSFLSIFVYDFICRKFLNRHSENKLLAGFYGEKYFIAVSLFLFAALPSLIAIWWTLNNSAKLTNERIELAYYNTLKKEHFSWNDVAKIEKGCAVFSKRRFYILATKQVLPFFRIITKFGDIVELVDVEFSKSSEVNIAFTLMKVIAKVDKYNIPVQTFQTSKDKKTCFSRIENRFPKYYNEITTILGT